MAKKSRTKGSRDKARPKRDWTFKLESRKVYLYLVEVLIAALYIVRVILDNVDEIRDNYFDLPEILVPMVLIIVIVGTQEVLFATLIGGFRKDLGEKYRFLEGAKRSAISTLIVAFIVAALMLAPPVQEMIEDASGRHVEKTKVLLYESFASKDALNLTGLRQLSVTTEDNVLFNVTLYRGDSRDTGEVVDNSSRVREWEHTFSLTDVDEFLVEAEAVSAPGKLTWQMDYEVELRPEVITGVAVPFLFLAILNLLFYPFARMWSSQTEEAYVDTQTRRLRARFKVEEAFLIYEDGRLIAHNSRRLKPERDKDIMTGMLTAVQSFVTDTLIDEERGTLDKLTYGKLTILVEPKGKVNLACIVSGEESPVLRQGMSNIVSYISTQYHRFLQDWDGDVDRFKDVKRYIGHLVSTGKEEPVWPDEVFVFHRDGRLVAHQTSRLEPSIDDGLLQNWVDQIVGAVKKTMLDPSKPLPPKLNVMGYDVLMEYTNYMSMAFMTTRKDMDSRRDLMVDVLHDIDERFHNLLYDWDGSTTELTDVKSMLEVVLETPGPPKR